MTQTTNLLAIDLGAESGRAILGTLDESSIHLEELHRFANVPVRLPDGLHWNVLHLWTEMKKGISFAADKTRKQLSGIGLDTWGVDFALLDEKGILIGNPYHYRDSRTDGMVEAAFKLVPRQDIFEQTGIQFMQINTLYQILSMVLTESGALKTASTFLTIPDLFNYWLSGHAVCEFTNATTTQLFDPRKRQWAQPLLEKLGIPVHIFPKFINPGSVIGEMQDTLCKELELPAIPILAPACHDTGSAVAAVPASNPKFAWISSGTWSVLGMEADEPYINPMTLEYNFTNEGGVGNTWRLSKNVMGLWIVQECKRTWAHQGADLSYDQITQMAAEAEPFQAVIDPDHLDFLMPGNMPERIQAYCRRTSQAVPQDRGSILRVVLESIALKYRWVLEKLEEVAGCSLDPIHIIGGGTKNTLLNRFTAEATGRRCVTGPVEATAVGNILMQAVALQRIPSIQAGRSMVRASFPVQVYEPETHKGWVEAYQKLLDLLP
jgi:rhamnulokinase